MGWREPEPQDIGRVVFNRGFRRTEGNLIKAKETLRNSYLSRREANVEQANIYFDEAMKDKPDAAWEALLKEVLKGDSKKIWHGEHMENLTADERRLVLPMMKNYIEKYTPAGDFEKSKVRVLVRGDLQDFVGETQGPVSRVESIHSNCHSQYINNFSTFYGKLLERGLKHINALVDPVFVFGHREETVVHRYGTVGYFIPLGLN